MRRIEKFLVVVVVMLVVFVGTKDVSATPNNQCYNKAMARDRALQTVTQFHHCGSAYDPCTGEFFEEGVCVYRNPDPYYYGQRWVYPSGTIVGFGGLGTTSGYLICSDGRAQVTQYVGAVWAGWANPWGYAPAWGLWYNFPFDYKIDCDSF